MLLQRRKNGILNTYKYKSFDYGEQWDSWGTMGQCPIVPHILCPIVPRSSVFERSVIIQETDCQIYASE